MRHWGVWGLLAFAACGGTVTEQSTGTGDAAGEAQGRDARSPDDATGRLDVAHSSASSAATDGGTERHPDAALDVTVPPVDAAHDAGVDAPRDAGIDAARDSGRDAARDGTNDVGVDAAADVRSRDARADALDARTDGGHDATTGDSGADAGVDTGSDGGEDAPADGADDAAVDAPLDGQADARADGAVDALPPFDAGSISPWSAHLGGSDYTAVAVDSQGNTLVGGTTAYESTNYLRFAQYDATGAPIWSKAPNSPPGMMVPGQLWGVAVDSTDAVAFVGLAEGALDFGGGLTANAGGGFVAKYDTNGNYLFANVYPNTVATSVARTANDGWVVVGTFTGDADFGPGTVDAPTGGTNAMFVVGLDARGTYQFGVGFAGTGRTYPSQVAVDGAGHILVAGNFDGTLSFGGGSMVGPTASSGPTASFVVSLDPSGNYLHQATFQVAGNEDTFTVATDSMNNVFVAGDFDTTINCGGSNLHSQGGRDIYVCALDSSLVYRWGHIYGDSNDQSGGRVAVDPADNVVMTGDMSGTVNFGGGPITAPDNTAVFVARFTGSSGAPISSGLVSGTYSTYVQGLAAPTTGPSEVIVGYFTGTIDFGQGSFVSSGNEGDGFVAWWVP